jgi:hypothetical protein
MNCGLSKKAVVVLKALSHNFPGGTEENNSNLSRDNQPLGRERILHIIQYTKC